MHQIWDPNKAKKILADQEIHQFLDTNTTNWY